MINQQSVLYHDLSPYQKRQVRNNYVVQQGGKCMYCNGSLLEDPPEHIRKKQIDRRLFPSQMFRHPIHLDHDHETGMTRGAVHAKCNAIMWQYEGR